MSKTIEDEAQEFAEINEDKKCNYSFSYNKYDIANAFQNGDLNASINLKNLAVSSTVTAFGDKSSDSKEFQLVDELGIKHQMFTFV